MFLQLSVVIVLFPDWKQNKPRTMRPQHHEQLFHA